MLFNQTSHLDAAKLFGATEGRRRFGKFAESSSIWAASPNAFVLALGFVLVWAIVGPLFSFSQHWENMIVEIPGVFTFFLVFLIQNSQSREMMAVQLKLNELIRATDGAHGMMLNLEKLTAEELALLCDQYEVLAREARKRLKRGESDEAVVAIPSPIEAIREIAEEIEDKIEDVIEEAGISKAS